VPQNVIETQPAAMLTGLFWPLSPLGRVVAGNELVVLTNSDRFAPAILRQGEQRGNCGSERGGRVGQERSVLSGCGWVTVYPREQ
jgi:hypothetical protein